MLDLNADEVEVEEEDERNPVHRDAARDVDEDEEDEEDGKALGFGFRDYIFWNLRLLGFVAFFCLVEFFGV